MTTTYLVYEISQARPIRRKGFETQAEAETEAAAYSRWYIVEQIETPRSFTREVVARSADVPHPQSTKMSKLARARARMAKGER